MTLEVRKRKCIPFSANVHTIRRIPVCNKYYCNMCNHTYSMCFAFGDFGEQFGTPTRGRVWYGWAFGFGSLQPYPTADNSAIDSGFGTQRTGAGGDRVDG